MRRESRLTHERLLEVLSYDSTTGIFTWTEKAKHPAKPHTAAGRAKDGYFRIGIDNEYHQGSALAWFYVNKAWPERNLQFKDGDRGNCAITNLEYGETNRGDKASMRAYRRKYDASNPGKMHAKRIKWNYGVTIEQYREMLLAQKGVCACCEKPETAVAKGKILPLCVDHDHADNTVRGLLCQHCNKMLGHAFDSTETLRRAAAYLEAHAAKPETNVIPLAGRRIGQS